MQISEEEKNRLIIAYKTGYDNGYHDANEDTIAVDEHKDAVDWVEKFQKNVTLEGDADG
jgi:hypothetical protein